MPVQLDVDGDLVADVAGDLNVIDPPATVVPGGTLRLHVSRLSTNVPFHIVAEIGLDEGIGSASLGVDGRGSTIPLDTVFSVNASGVGERVVALNASVSDEPSGWALTLGSVPGDGTRVSLRLPEPGQTFNGTLTSNAAAGSFAWNGDPIDEVAVKVAGNGRAVDAVLTDVPPTMRMSFSGSIAAGRLDYRASAGTLDIDATIVIGGKAVEFNATDLSTDLFAIYNQSSSPYLNIGSQLPGATRTASIGFGYRLERHVDRETTVNGIKLRVIADVVAPDFSLTATNVAWLVVGDAGATLQFTGSYTRVDASLQGNEPPTITYRVCWRLICGTPKVVNKLDSHRFIPGWRLESHHVGTVRCNSVLEPKKVWHTRKWFQPAWQGVLSSTTSFAVTGGTQWIYLIPPGELDEHEVRETVADDLYGSDGSDTKVNCE